MWAKGFIMVSMGRNRQSRVNKVRIGQFEYFQWAPGHRAVPSCLVSGPGVIRKGE